MATQQRIKRQESRSGLQARFYSDKMLWALFLPLMAEQFLKYSLGIADYTPLIFVLAPGAFITLGYLIALINKLRKA